MPIFQFTHAPVLEMLSCRTSIGIETRVRPHEGSASGHGGGVERDRLVTCERDGLLSDESFYDRSQLLGHSHIKLFQ